MTSTPLNEEALEVAARATYEMRNPESWARDWEELGTEEREEEWVKPARAAVSAYLSALPADTVNSVEELDALKRYLCVCGKYITLTKAGVFRHHRGNERDYPGSPWRKVCVGAGVKP